MTCGPISCEVGSATARAWLRHFPARRNAGARSCYARANRRSAKYRCLRRRRKIEALPSRITISRRSVSAKPDAPAAQAVAKLVTARWLNVRSSRSFRGVENFRYAIRISSEIMESNGSTSMASVCAGMLALMDAGVPIKTPVAGISVGLVTRVRRRRPAQSLQLAHRHHRIGRSFRRHGFQALRHREGVTGFQLDLKLPGVSHKIMAEADHRARRSAHENSRHHGRRASTNRART